MLAALRPLSQRHLADPVPYYYLLSVLFQAGVFVYIQESTIKNVYTQESLKPVDRVLPYGWGRVRLVLQIP